MQYLDPANDRDGSQPELPSTGLMSALASCGHNAKSGFVSTVPLAVVSRCSKQHRHSISSSAAADSPSGTSRPSVLAVFRLMTSANFVDSWTGKSLGCAPKNPANVDARYAIPICNADAIAHQTTGRGKLTNVINGRHRVTCRQLGNLIAPAEKECVGADHECTNTQLNHCCKNAIEVGRGAGM